MVQVVDFTTWTRLYNVQSRTSILDHIYTSKPLSVLNLSHTWPVFTDHALIMFEISSNKMQPDVTIRRDWRNYSKEKLCQGLSKHNWSFTSDSVQAYWNQLENQLIKIIDELVPLVEHRNTNIEAPVPSYIKHKLNERKRLLKSNRRDFTVARSERIKKLNNEIKTHFHTKMKKKVRRIIVPGNNQSLWKAVKIARDIN